MDTEKNKAAVIRYFEQVWDKGNLAVIDELFDQNYTVDKLPSWREPGAEGLKKFIADNHRMFPDVRNTIEEIIAESNKVVAQISAVATHEGDLTGPVGIVPATHKKITWHAIFIFYFENGKIVRTSGITDNMELMQQLGAIPS